MLLAEAVFFLKESIEAFEAIAVLTEAVSSIEGISLEITKVFPKPILFDVRLLSSFRSAIVVPNFLAILPKLSPAATTYSCD
ncbi:hypothetical protein D3C72_2376430 [compost metagenome]